MRRLGLCALLLCGSASTFALSGCERVYGITNASGSANALTTSSQNGTGSSAAAAPHFIPKVAPSGAQPACASAWGTHPAFTINQNCSLSDVGATLVTHFNQKYFNGSLTSDQITFFESIFALFDFHTQDAYSGGNSCEEPVASSSIPDLYILKPLTDIGLTATSGDLRFIYELPVPAPAGSASVNSALGINYLDADKSGSTDSQRLIPFQITRASGAIVSVTTVSYSIDSSQNVTFYDDQGQAIPSSSVVLDTCSLLN